jgi:hypothetical protein
MKAKSKTPNASYPRVILKLPLLVGTALQDELVLVDEVCDLVDEDEVEVVEMLVLLVLEELIVLVVVVLVAVELEVAVGGN